MSASTRLVLVFVFAIVVVIGTAYVQILTHFSTYIALAVCLAATFICSRILYGKK
jgi:hypothetical protein